MSNPKFAICAMHFDHAIDELVVELECPERDRNYVVTWNPLKAASLTLVKHWQSDCVESTSALCPSEMRDVERFVDSSDEVAEAFIELGQQRSRPITPSHLHSKGDGHVQEC